MPDLNNRSEVISEIKSYLFWAGIGYFLYLGITTGSMYIKFIGLLTGGTMIGSKFLAKLGKPKSKYGFDTDINYNESQISRPNSESQVDLSSQELPYKHNSILDESIRNNNSSANYIDMFHDNGRMKMTAEVKLKLEVERHFQTNQYLTANEYNHLKKYVVVKLSQRREELITDSSSAKFERDEINNSFSPEDLI